jgi:ArsR family metal-binding transcriptional regulator
MLLKSYTIRIVPPEHNSLAHTVNAIAELSDDISEALPYLNTVVKGCCYHPEARVLGFVKDDKRITLYPRQIIVTNLKDEREARKVLESVKQLINGAYAGRGAIDPSYLMGDEVTVLTVYRLLPGTNCQECGEPTCLHFAIKLAKRKADVNDCAPLFSEEHNDSREKLLSMLAAEGHV